MAQVEYGEQLGLATPTPTPSPNPNPDPDSHQAKQLHAQRQATGAGAKAGQPTLETCVGTTAIALGMVMAGSGNLECLRLFRVLRRRVDSEVRQP